LKYLYLKEDSCVKSYYSRWFVYLLYLFIYKTFTKHEPLLSFGTVRWEIYKLKFLFLLLPALLLLPIQFVIAI